MTYSSAANRASCVRNLTCFNTSTQGQWPANDVGSIAGSTVPDEFDKGMGFGAISPIRDCVDSCRLVFWHRKG